MSAELVLGAYVAEEQNPGHIVVRRLDGQPCDPTWYELWRIKNLVAGTGATAIEIFPATDALVDGENHRHLFVVPGDLLGVLPCLKQGRVWPSEAEPQ